MRSLWDWLTSCHVCTASLLLSCNFNFDFCFFSARSVFGNGWRMPLLSGSLWVKLKEVLMPKIFEDKRYATRVKWDLYEIGWPVVMFAQLVCSSRNSFTFSAFPFSMVADSSPRLLTIALGQLGQLTKTAPLEIGAPWRSRCGIMKRLGWLQV